VGNVELRVYAVQKLHFVKRVLCINEGTTCTKLFRSRRRQVVWLHQPTEPTIAGTPSSWPLLLGPLVLGLSPDHRGLDQGLPHTLSIVGCGYLRPLCAPPSYKLPDDTSCSSSTMSLHSCCYFYSYIRAYIRQLLLADQTSP
jgi:hypothetical protein